MDDYGSLYFECPDGHKNKREKGKLKAECAVCGCDVSCGMVSSEKTNTGNQGTVTSVATLMKEILGKQSKKKAAA